MSNKAPYDTVNVLSEGVILAAKQRPQGEGQNFHE